MFIRLADELVGAIKEEKIPSFEQDPCIGTSQAEKWGKLP